MTDLECISEAVTINESLKQLQLSPDGINVAIQTNGGIDVVPEVTVSGDPSSPVKEHDVLALSPQKTVASTDNLHFVINAPGGLVQIGNCCIMLRVNFEDYLIEKLLHDGDLQINLTSDDVLVQINWSNWAQKKAGIMSRIKVDFEAEITDDKDFALTEILRGLINEKSEFKALRDITNILYERFHALVYKITGGCFEFWIMTETVQLLHRIQTRKGELENILSRVLISDLKNTALNKKGVRLKVDILNETTMSLAELPSNRRSDLDTQCESHSLNYQASPEKIKELIEKSIEECKANQQELFANLGYMSEARASPSFGDESKFYSDKQLAYVDTNEFLSRVNLHIKSAIDKHNVGSEVHDPTLRMHGFKEQLLQRAGQEILETVRFLLSSFAFNIGIDAFEEEMAPEFESMINDLIAIVDFSHTRSETIAAEVEHRVNLRSKQVIWKCKLALENYFYNHLAFKSKR